MKLLIVESPTKSRTIKKFLGQKFQVLSSYGHIRDLPANRLGVDVKNNFKPQYIILPQKKKILKDLKSKTKKAQEVILAVDEDREGEAIAWHLAQTLNLKNPKRIVFHEITKQAILQALKKPRGIDMNLVNAQQTRRILDRLVGYKLSPFLWKKIMRGLSAGRVQSVALRLICEREKEIENFQPKEYWTIKAVLLKQGGEKEAQNQKFEALLFAKKGKKLSRFAIKNKKEAQAIVDDLKEAQYQVATLEKKERQQNPPPPFITSTLQRIAAQRFNFSAKKTMVLAQELYERGYITYHRTDSLHLSSQFLKQAESFIKKEFGEKYSRSTQYKTKSLLSQEAHEAIRPTDLKRRSLKEKKLSKLYSLIWQRAVASQMAPAIFDTVKAEIQAKDWIFQAQGQTIRFEGFLRVYPLKFKEEPLPVLKIGEKLTLKKLSPNQHFTQPPARYTEATLIKVLEKEGIGRPSTYAPTLEIIQKRNYVKKDKNKRLFPTKIGKMVNELLVEHFPQIVDIKFTANMEDKLDKIAAGKKNWVETLKEFYIPFMKNIKEKLKEVPKKDLTEKTDKTCRECGGEVVIRLGRYGRFYACSNFPNCKWTKNLPPETTGVKCPQCQEGDIVLKKTKQGKPFYGCNRWPDCDFALWEKPVNKKCPQCGALLVEKSQNKITCSNKNCSPKQ